MFPDIVREAGYTFDEVEGIEQATAQQMLNIALAGGVGGADILARWRTDLALVSRLELVAECIIDGDFIEELWRHDQPETAWVLDAAGKHVTDKALAKRARKAAMQHRTWMANQGR